MKDKRLINIAQKAAIGSFTKGALDNKKAQDFVTQFKKLPLNESLMVLKEFAKALRREIDKVTLLVESAIPLTREQLKKIELSMGKGHKITKIENQINPSLLGGFRFKIGDMQYDSSVKNKIEQIGGFVRG